MSVEAVYTSSCLLRFCQFVGVASHRVLNFCRPGVVLFAKSIRIFYDAIYLFDLDFIFISLHTGIFTEDYRRNRYELSRTGPRSAFIIKCQIRIRIRA